MRCWVGLVALAWSIGVAAVGGATDWPGWRGPNGDGISPETGLLKVWPADGPRVVWRAELYGGYSSMAVAEGRLFTLTKDKDEELVLSFDAHSGVKLWRYGYRADYAAEPALIEAPQVDSLSGPRATPAVDDDRVYTIGTTGVVCCLEAATGRLLWQGDLKRIGACSCPRHGFCASPVVAGDLLFVQTGGGDGKSAAALNKRTGRVVWQALDDAIGYATPVYYRWNGAPQILFFTGEGLAALEPTSGRLLWRFEWKDDETKLNIATPVYVDGHVFLSSYLNGGAVLRLEKRGKAARVWKNTAMQNHFSSSVHYEGFLYGFSNTRLRCVDFATGKTCWDKTGLGKGSVLLADGRLIVLGGRGDLVLLEATPRGYVEASRCKPLEAPTLTAPALADGLLYVRNENVLLALDVRGR